MQRRGGTRLQRWRVPLGFLCAAIFILLAKPTTISLAVGGVVAIIGLAIRAWAAGHIRKNASLATTGPYAYTRNPLYLGSFFLGLGFTIAAGRWVLALLFAAVFLGIYLPVMRVEATTLTEIFGDRYRNYATVVPLFIPSLRPYPRDNGSVNGFERSLYLKYREYRAALGMVIVWGVLALKAYYLK